jgi:hypothetical protein
MQKNLKIVIFVIYYSIVLGDSEHVGPNFTAFAVKEVPQLQLCLLRRQAPISSHGCRSHY